MLKEDKMAEAIKELKNGNVEGFNYIYSETFDFVYSRAKYMLGEEELALDLTQEVYLILYNKIGDLNSSESLYAWLKTVIFHKGLRFIEKRNKTVLLTEESEDVFDALQDDSIDLEEDIVNQEDVQIIKNCINSLSDEQRLVILAYYYDNMKVHEIAETLHISEGTVKSRLSLARKHLKNIILEQEKKQGYKLHSFGSVTMAFILGGMLNSNMSSARGVMQTLLSSLHVQLGIVASTVSGVVEGVTSATNNGAKESTKLAKHVLKKTAPKGTKKLVAGIVGSVAVTVAVGATIIGITNKNEQKQELTIEAEQMGDETKSEYQTVYMLINEIDHSEESGRISRNEYVYNKEERKITVIKNYGYTETSDKWEYTYDENGKLINEKHYKGDGVLEYCEEYTYDDNGNLIGMIHDDYDSSDYRIEYVYDENCNLISKVKYDETGAVETREECIYDENGNLLSKKSEDYVWSNFYDYTYEYTFDKKGNVLSQTQFDNGMLSNREEYTYDKKGNLISGITYGGDDIVDYVENYIYDEDGKCTRYETIQYNYGVEGQTFTSTHNYIYDENGHQISRSFIGSIGTKEGQTSSFEMEYIHEYDEKGNCIRKTYYNDGVLSSTTDYEYKAVEMTESEKNFYVTEFYEIRRQRS